MRILHCLRAPVGGLFRHVLDLSREQARLGHDVGIVADQNAEDALTNVKFARVAEHLTLGIRRIPMARAPGLGDYQASRAVAAHARTLNLDVLHGHGAKGGAYARLARRTLRRDGQMVRAFYTPHGGTLNFPQGSPVTALYTRLERVLERQCDGLIFESAFAERAYAEKIGTPQCAARVIHNGLAASDFEISALSETATDVVFVGELRDLKGVHVLLDALHALQATRTVTATIVGAGPDAAKLQAQSTALGLDGVVTFTGALPARDAFKRGRVVVVPSLKESFPYIVLEAAAAGKPIVATSVGGIPEITGDVVPLIEPGSVSALVAALAPLINDQSAAALRADALRDRVGRMFTVSTMTAAVLDFYGAR